MRPIWMRDVPSGFEKKSVRLPIRRLGRKRPLALAQGQRAAARREVRPSVAALGLGVRGQEAGSQEVGLA